MNRFARVFYSWKLILLTTGISAFMLILSIFVLGLRSYALPIGFMAALLHFVLSGWLFRDYLYGGADFDTEDSYAPSGLSKALYMMASFIGLLALFLAVAILNSEQGCYSAFLCSK